MWVQDPSHYMRGCVSSYYQGCIKPSRASSKNPNQHRTISNQHIIFNIPSRVPSNHHVWVQRLLQGLPHTCQIPYKVIIIIMVERIIYKGSMTPTRVARSSPTQKGPLQQGCHHLKHTRSPRIPSPFLQGCKDHQTTKCGSKGFFKGFHKQVKDNTRSSSS